MATLTPVGGATPYCSNTDFILRYDVRTIGDLLSDIGIRLTPAGVAGSAILTELLAEASGDLETDCLVGQRYTAADLAALFTAGGNGKAILIRMVADICLFNILNRRPDPKRELPRNVQLNEAKRELLRLGRAIFPFQEAADAGKRVIRAATPFPLVSQKTPKLFGTVNDRWPWPGCSEW